MLQKHKLLILVLALLTVGWFYIVISQDTEIVTEQKIDQIIDQPTKYLEPKRYLTRPEISADTLMKMNKRKTLPARTALEDGPQKPALATNEQKEFPDIAGHFADKDIFVTSREYADFDNDGVEEQLWNLHGPWMNNSPHGFVIVDDGEIIFSFHIADDYEDLTFESAYAYFAEDGSLNMIGIHHLKYHLSEDVLSEIMGDSNILPYESEKYKFIYKDKKFEIMSEKTPFSGLYNTNEQLPEVPTNEEWESYLATTDVFENLYREKATKYGDIVKRFYIGQEYPQEIDIIEADITNDGTPEQIVSFDGGGTYGITEYKIIQNETVIATLKPQSVGRSGEFIPDPNGNGFSLKWYTDDMFPNGYCCPANQMVTVFEYTNGEFSPMEEWEEKAD